MHYAPDPRVEQWYRANTGDHFEIVALDEDDGTIEIQYFDGTVEEIDLDGWEALEASIAAPPEDWSGSVDIQQDDYGVEIELRHFDPWESPLDPYDHPKSP